MSNVDIEPTIHAIFTEAEKNIKLAEGWTLLNAEPYKDKFGSPKIVYIMQEKRLAQK
jgi:hypothetical protein